MSDNRTTELREKLTERGVKYDVKALRETEWTVNGVIWHANEYDGKLNVYVRNNDMLLTPEQAIAATLGVDAKDCENLLWEFIGALDVADATDADKKPIVSDYARHIAATLGSEREKALESLLRDWRACDPRCTNRSCGDCEHDEDDGCGLYRRMCELGVIA